MFDEREFSELMATYMECVASVKSYRQEHGVALSEVPVDALFEPLRRHHETLTGIAMSHEAIRYHDLARLGPDCPSCGKPLRTPQARLCPQCGWKELG